MRRNTPCDLDGICPYANDPTGATCDYWCHYSEDDAEDNLNDYYKEEFEV